MQTVKKTKWFDVEIYEFGYSPISKPLMTVCNFWVEGLMIDTAQRNAQKLVAKTFQHKPIEQIALTHWHEDHIGNTAYFFQKYKPTIFCHPFTAQKLQTGFKVLFYEQFMFGKIDAYPIITQDFPEKICTAKYEFTPIHTPGHSADHTVFLEKNQGWLFSGDLFVSPKIKYFRKGEDLGEQILSIKKILQYDFDTIFCGHYPQKTNGKELFRLKLQYFEDFYEAVKNYYYQGLGSKEIMKALKIKEVHWLKYVTCLDVSVEYMVTSVIRREKKLQKQNLMTTN